MKKFNCNKCGQLCDNVSGGDCVVEKDGQQKRVCAKCSGELAHEGWKEVSRARRV